MKLNSLNEKYLNGTLDEARRSQQEAVKLIAEAHLTLRGEAMAFHFAFGKLYALEIQSGNERAAEGYLVKARYWYLRSEEVANPIITDTLADEALSSSMGPDMRKFDGQSLMAEMDRMAKGSTEGRGPAYTLHLPPTARSPATTAVD